MTSTSLRNVITRGTWSQTKSWREYHKVGGQGLPKMLSRKSRKKTDQELDRLAHWIFINGLQVESLRSELRKEPFVGYAVTVGLAIDLGISSATQPQPVTMRDDDDDAWSTTATIGEQNTRNASTQTEMAVLEAAFSPEFHFRLIQLVISGQQKMRWALEHLMQGQQAIVGGQQVQTRSRVVCQRCGQEGHYSRGCAR